VAVFITVDGIAHRVNAQQMADELWCTTVAPAARGGKTCGRV
jgi:hypothetical protein